MKDWAILLFLVALLSLAACTPADEGAAVAAPVGLAQIELVAGGVDLSLQGKLALGIVRLEETDKAVSVAQATELLPLWQALQALSNSDTTADVEIEAVVRQIQKAITPEQLQAIDAMALTAESLTELQESGAPGFGFRQEVPTDDTGGSGARPQFGGGGPPPGDFVMIGPGGGPGGGFAGGAGANLSEDDLATRQAEFANIDPADMQNRMLTMMVIRVLGSKTGDISADPGAMMDMVFAAISEATGLSAEEIRSQTADSKTLVEVIEAAGGDVAAVRAQLVEALRALPNAADLDVERMADQWLGQSRQQPSTPVP